MTLQNAENFTVFSGPDFLEKNKALQNERRRELAFGQCAIINEQLENTPAAIYDCHMKTSTNPLAVPSDSNKSLKPFTTEESRRGSETPSTHTVPLPCRFPKSPWAKFRPGFSIRGKV
jgi:hypothetical protein